MEAQREIVKKGNKTFIEFTRQDIEKQKQFNDEALWAAKSMRKINELLNEIVFDHRVPQDVKIKIHEVRKEINRK